MNLSMRKWQVSSVEPGQRTVLRDGVLTVDVETLAALVVELDECIVNASVHVALPGDATRILCVKDVVAPRVSPDGSEPGSGVTNALEGIAVATCGPIVGFQEGIVDMSGPGAAHTPFSALALVVLEIDVATGTDPHAHEAAVRTAGLFAAEYLAGTTDGLEPDETESWQLDETPPDSGLPRIVYVDMVLTQGLLHDTWILGKYAGDVLPAMFDPCVLIDGGIVSGNCVSACDKTTTWHHQNNPVILELLGGHGTRWIFAGVVVTNEPTRLALKQESATRAVELARALEPDGAIISKEGFGNPDADLMLIIAGLEAAGIRTVAITDEYAGADGASQSLADAAPQADALVSTGNANERIVLPPMSTVIGPLPDVARLAGGYAHSLREDGAMEVELQAIVGSTNQLGFGRLSCRTI